MFTLFRKKITGFIKLSNVTILKRAMAFKTSDTYAQRTLYPIRPYHERWKNYISKRNFIFNISSISTLTSKRPKRSTIRLRIYYKNRKMSSKFIISSIIHSQHDKRYYGKVEFLNFIEYGLLDSGANVSCIGADLSNIDFNKLQNFTPMRSYVKTADGTRQKTTGVLNVDVIFKGQTHKLILLIVPSLSQRLILGLNFWKLFHLGSDIVDCNIFVNSGKYSQN